MAKMIYAGFDYVDAQLKKLDGITQGEMTKRVLSAGAKVIEKEMKKAIEDNHHVVSGAMKESVKPGEIKINIDYSSVEVYTQGNDPRGVSNEMKNKRINYGPGVRKRDHYITKLRKRIEPRVLSVMNYEAKLVLKEQGLIE